MLKRIWLAMVCLVNITCTGCCIPMITGGNVDLEVYLGNDPDDRLLYLPEFGANGLRKAPDITQRARRVSRAVVIPCYDGDLTGDLHAACVVTPAKRLIGYKRRIEIADWMPLPEGRFYPRGRRRYTAWVFVEGGWPMYLEESDPCHLGWLTSKWAQHPKVPWGLEAKGIAVCYPSSRPWDKFVAAGVGYELVKPSKEDDPDTVSAIGTHIGDHYALREAMCLIPCPFIKSVDDAKGKLTDEDRLLVFRETLRLYELTKSYWDNDDPTGYDTTHREAYEQNTRLLRERIDALETNK